jgi:hypothetical protein
MNSRKTSGAPGKHQEVASDNSLEVLCGNHAGPRAGGEKPHLWWDRDTQEWVCWDHNQQHDVTYLAGVGATPITAYEMWQKCQTLKPRYPIGDVFSKDTMDAWVALLKEVQ